MNTFLFGAPRSGTTWLWSMIATHPDVAAFHIKGRSESGVYRKKNAKKAIEYFAKKNNGKLILEKTPLHTFYAAQIKEDFPFSKNIVLFRHPMAIVNSMLRSDMDAFYKYTLLQSIQEVQRYYEFLPRIDGLRIFYEELIAHTEIELEHIFKYLRLRTNTVPEIVEKTKNKPTVSVRGVFRKGQPNAYQKEMTPVELETCESELKVEIELFNELKEAV